MTSLSVCSRAYSDSTIPLETPWDDLAITAIDLETTGTGPHDRIIEVGIVRLQGDDVVDSLSLLINPERGIPVESTIVHGIMDGHVEDAPTLAEVEGRVIWRLWQADVIVAHQLAFDWRFLARELGQKTLPRLTISLDTLKADRRLSKGKHGLAACAKRWGVEMKRHHRALDDALASGRIARKMTMGLTVARMNTGEVWRFL